MKPTPEECARLDAATACPTGPAPPPALPGVEAVPSLADLLRYRRARLAKA